MKRKKHESLRRALFTFYLLLFPLLTLSAAPADDGGVVRMMPDSASVSGGARVEKSGEIESVAGLGGPKDQVHWTGEVDRPGSYAVTLTYACDPESAGGQCKVEIAGQTLIQTIASTGGWDDFTSVTVGLTQIEREFRVTICGLRTDNSPLMRLRSVILKPATASQAQRREGAATRPASADGQAIIANIDVSEVPQLEDWALAARERAIKWYPIIRTALQTDGFAPPRKFDLIFRRDMPGVAGTAGDRIAISSAWVTAHPEDFGMVGHELTHVIQHYPQSNAGWLVEGIADYIRYYVLEPGSRQAHFNTATSSYKQGYQPAAGLLHFLETTRAPGIVAKLNTALRDGKYSDALFQQLAGDDLDALWKACKDFVNKSERGSNKPG